MNRKIIILILCISGMLGFGLSLWRNWNPIIYTQPEIEKQIVRDTFHSPATFVKQLINDKQAGQKIFREFCSVCHGKSAVIPVHAPIIGDKEHWRVLKQLKMNKLLDLTIKGVGAMPARGGCFECSDEQLQQTIQYILDNS